ncbi:MAG: hypothetical protein Q7K03_07220 [Dehalococcoidia bacterium]|nr:hypothetical protein [Dehalococcoidia bacterium]
MSRCLHCGRPISEGQSPSAPLRTCFCRRWWAQLSTEERAEAGMPPGLLRVVARQALARLEARSAAPSEVAV